MHPAHAADRRVAPGRLVDGRRGRFRNGAAVAAKRRAAGAAGADRYAFAQRGLDRQQRAVLAADDGARPRYRLGSIGPELAAARRTGAGPALCSGLGRADRHPARQDRGR